MARPSDPALAPAAPTSAATATLMHQRRLLWAVTALAVAMLAGTSAWFAWHERGQELDAAAALAQRRADLLATELEQTLRIAQVAIDQTEAVLRRLPAAAPLAAAWDDAAANRAALLAALPLPFELHAHDAQGRLLGGLTARSSTPELHEHRLPPPADASGAWVVGDVVLEGSPPLRALPLLRRAAPNAQGVAWYSADLSHATLVARLQAERVLGGGAAVFRIERDGSAISVLARAPLNEAELGRKVRGPLHAAVQRETHGIFRDVTQLDGVERIVGYRRLSGSATDLLVGYGMNTGEVLAAWRTTTPLQAGATLLLAALLLYGGWRLDRSLRDSAAGFAALGRSETLYRTLADNLPDVLVRFDRELRFVYANARVQRATGMAPAEFIGKTSAEVGMPAENVALWTAAIQRVFDSGQPEHFEFTFAGPLGRHHWDTVVVPEPSPGGPARTVLAICRDVTKRHLADEALRRSEARFRLASSYGQVWDWDIAANRIDPQAAYWHALGLPVPEPAQAVAAFEGTLHPDDRARWRQALREHLALRLPYALQYRARAADGSYRWFQTQGQAVWDDNGRAAYMAGTTFDITEQRRLEEAVRASEARLRHLVANSPAVIYTARAGGDYAATFYSANLVVLLGYAPREFIDDPGFWLDRIHPDDRGAVLAALDGVFHQEGLLALEYRFRHRDGGWRWVRDEVRLIRDAAGAPLELIGSWIDITERREAEDEVRRLNAELERRVLDRTGELARSERRYRNIFELTPTAIVEEDWSEAIRLLAPHRQAAAADPRAWLRGQPFLVAQCLQAVRVVRLNPAAALLYGLAPDADAPRRLAELFAAYDNSEGFADELATLLAGQRRHNQARQLHRADGEWRQVQLALSLPGMDAGNDGIALASLIDVTELHRLSTELDASLAQARRANRELETFTYSVSHDLKAPLRGIDGYSRLLLRDHDAQLDEEGRTFLGNIRQAAQQMAQLIDDLLAYSRLERRPQDLLALNLDAAVRAVLAPYDSELRSHGVQLALDIPARLRVLGDSQSLALALRNLIDNALKFSRDATPPRIELRATESGGAATLSVHDNGIGFDMKFHDRIFDIFQRLHRAEDYAGTGVGLAIVRKAMERMGGRVWADSQPGQGATFHLQLPSTP